MMVGGQVRAAAASPVSAGGRCAGAVVFLAALAMMVGFHATAFAQGAVRSVHGDWQIRCETPPGAQSEQCALFQSVVAEDRANVGITVLVLKTADQKSRLMRVQVPLGVLLPAGLGLKIDQVDVGRAGYVRCLPRGCYAEVVMDDTLIGKMKTGQTATFFERAAPNKPPRHIGPHGDRPRAMASVRGCRQGSITPRIDEDVVPAWGWMARRFDRGFRHEAPTQR
jgi:invasion protein IalB